jgi:transcriptional regulator with GAF, ATPase, and Fis domain
VLQFGDQRCEEKRSNHDRQLYLQEEIRSEHNFGEIVGSSPALLDVLRQVEQIARIDSTVLILGETGTGKELVARGIHDRSPRKSRALVKVNCGAISAGLVESELFGTSKARSPAQSPIATDASSWRTAEQFFSTRWVNFRSTHR